METIQQSVYAFAILDIPELRAAGLMVPEPSVTPRPFDVWALYILQLTLTARRCRRREARQYPVVGRPQSCGSVSLESASARL